MVHNLFLGRELKSGITLNETDMEKRAGDTLRSLSVRTLRSLRQQVSSLSGGQRQTVAIARAVLWNSKMVILDEPTAALGVAQTEQVLALVKRLTEHGLAVVLITHNMNDVFAGGRQHRVPVSGADGRAGQGQGRLARAGGGADHRRALG